MRLMLMTILLLCGVPANLSAQENVVVQSVLSANPAEDGKAYALSVLLQDGRRLSLELSPPDAAKIVDGLSKLAGSGPQKQQLVAVVQGIGIQADPHGKFVVLQPRSGKGTLQALAIPLEGADHFLQLFQQKAAETKANATTSPQTPPQGEMHRQP